jgi:hypothetical protein
MDMKRKLINLVAATFLVFLTTGLFADNPPPPNGGSNPNSNGNVPVGGGTPIGSGLGILLVLGAVYGGKKIFKMDRQEEQV